MKTIIFILCTLSTLSLWASPQTIENFNRHTFKPSLKSLKSTEEDCRAHIRKITCLTEGAYTERNRTCLPGSESYAHFFEEIHDNFPPVLQKVFCSLQNINVEKEFFGTAYAEVDPVTNKVFIGIRKSVIDENLDLTAWSSWKEQLSFGGISDSYTTMPHLPVHETGNSHKVNDFLYFVIAHEFGHVIDFANELNVTESCLSEDCQLKAGTWGSISWETYKTAKPENEFLYRKGLCFYTCEGKFLDPSTVEPIYEALVHRSDFVSLYATTQPWDDFADSLAYVMIHQNLKASYVIHSNQGTSYDIIKKVSSPLFAKKLHFINQLLKDSNLRYP